MGTVTAVERMKKVHNAPKEVLVLNEPIRNIQAELALDKGPKTNLTDALLQ